MARRGSGSEPHPILNELGQPDRYRLLGLLGEGSLGRVERVFDARLGRVVARKSLRAELRETESALRTFANEVRILGRLEHRGVLPIFDAWVTEEGRPVYTMREIAGESLASLLRIDPKSGQATPLALDRTLSIWTQIAAALAHAHARGVIHLDLKPQNLIVMPGDEVVLVDWGSATIHDPARFVEGIEDVAEQLALDPTAHQSDEFIVGTPRYMSPEQTENARSTLTPASDLFSLGVLFFQMATGRLPFEGESLEELLFHVRETPAPNPRAIARSVHPRLAGLIARMLEKAPERRPADMGVVLDELAAFRGTAAEFPLMERAAGELLFAEGDEAHTAYVIVEGEVEVWTEQGGVRRVLGRHVAGEPVGELALLRNAPRSASASARTDVRLRVIRRQALAAEVEKLSPWVLAILSGVVERFVDRSERLIELLERDGASEEAD